MIDFDKPLGMAQLDTEMVQEEDDGFAQPLQAEASLNCLVDKPSQVVDDIQGAP